MNARSGQPYGNSHTIPHRPLIRSDANMLPEAADDFACKQHRLYGGDLQQQEKLVSERCARRRAKACYQDWRSAPTIINLLPFLLADPADMPDPTVE
jgi:hypothetical protein